MYACNAVTTDQLLSLRDGEPVAVEAAQHAERCAACAHELTRLRGMQTALRMLPQLPPPAYDGIALRAKLFRSRAPRTYRWVSVAVAASVSVIAVSVLFANLRNRA